MRRISSVQQGSPANRYRIKPGDILLSVNGEPVLDEIDYQALTAQRHIKLVVSSVNGETREIELAKPLDKPLGLQFDDSLIGNPKTCGNQCVFCFVNQMPKGMRASLYVKDDEIAAHTFSEEKRILKKKSFDKLKMKGIHHLRIEFTLKNHRAFKNRGMDHIRTIGDLINHY